jgi:hypothetical protein
VRAEVWSQREAVIRCRLKRCASGALSACAWEQRGISVEVARQRCLDTGRRPIRTGVGWLCSTMSKLRREGSESD